MKPRSSTSQSSGIWLRIDAVGRLQYVRGLLHVLDVEEEDTVRLFQRRGAGHAERVPVGEVVPDVRVDHPRADRLGELDQEVEGIRVTAYEARDDQRTPRVDECLGE